MSHSRSSPVQVGGWHEYQMHEHQAGSITVSVFEASCCNVPAVTVLCGPVGATVRSQNGDILSAPFPPALLPLPCSLGQLQKLSSWFSYLLSSFFFPPCHVSGFVDDQEWVVVMCGESGLGPIH